MYWLLSEEQRSEIRDKITNLTIALSHISGNPHEDQTFPYVGRKDRRKAIEAVRYLSSQSGTVLDPFVGSGSIAYAVAEEGRTLLANEWEPYAWRMSNAPWRLPEESEFIRI